MKTLELFANSANLMSVILARKNNHNTWWIGIFGCVLYSILFFDVKLYADVILQFFFIGISLYGWWNWLHGGNNKKELPISSLTKIKLLQFALLSLSIGIAYGYLLYRLTDASLPFMDSAVLVFSILAQFLLMSRKRENWIFWIIVNLIAIPVYLYKGLILTAFIYMAFLVNAVWGLNTWNKLLNAHEKISA